MLDPQQLLDLAREQADSPGAGAPRQVVLRRAVSTAYYAVFHMLCGAMAEIFVPANLPKSRALFYRSPDHKKTKERCKRLGQNPLHSEERSFFGFAAFSSELRTFANTFVLLQELRHRCDYDPEYKLSKAQAQQAVDDATQAIGSFAAANSDEKNQFLAYLLFAVRPL